MRRSVRSVGKAIMGVGAVALTIGALGTPPASGAPVQLLQTVDVEVAADGSIPGIEVTDLSAKKGSDDTSSESRSLDPSEVASGLPVSVRTSYQLDGTSGTDLTDLKDKSGDLSIDVTVTNTTGKVQPITVTDALSGETVARQMMVTTPVTVILTAQLPEDLASQIDRDPTKTNAAVARKDGKTIVQWGAVLAPPAVAGSSTFSLHVQGGKFRIEKMAMTVELGVQSDFSLDRIVGDVFGGSAQQDDSDAYATSDEVNRSLDGIALSLNAINTALTQDAVKGAKGIVQALADGRRELETQATGLRSAVESNLSRFSANTGTVTSQTGSALEDSIDTTTGKFGEFQAGTDASLTKASNQLLDAVDKFNARIGFGKDLKPNGEGLLATIEDLQDALVQDPDPDPLAVASLRDRIWALLGVSNTAFEFDENGNWQGAPPCPVDPLPPAQEPAEEPLFCSIYRLKHLNQAQASALDSAANLVDPAITGGKDGIGDAQDAVDNVVQALGAPGSANPDEVQGQITDLLAALASARTAVTTGVGSDLTDAKAKLQELKATVASVETALTNATLASADARELITGPGQLFDLIGRLDGGDGIESLAEVLGSASADATAARAELIARIDALATSVCASDQVPTDILDALKADVGAGVTVTDDPAAVASIKETLEAKVRLFLDNEKCDGTTNPVAADDLVAAATLTDLTGANAKLATIVAKKAAIEGKLDTLDDELADALGASGIIKIETEVDAVEQALDDAASSLDDPGGSGVDQQLADLETFVADTLSATVETQRNALDGAGTTDVTDLLGDATETLETLREDLISDDPNDIGILPQVQSTLDALISNRESRLNDSTRKALQDADAEIQALRQRLEQPKEDLGALSKDLVAQAEAQRSALDRSKVDLNRASNEVLASIVKRLRDTKLRLDQIQRDTEAATDLVQKQTDEGLDQSEQAILDSTGSAFLALTGTKTPDPNASTLSNSGYQGTLSTRLGQVSAEVQRLGGTNALASKFKGVRHAAYLANVFRAQQQELGRQQADPSQQRPFDGKVDDQSSVASVFVYTFPGVK